MRLWKISSKDEVGLYNMHLHRRSKMSARYYLSNSFHDGSFFMLLLLSAVFF